MDHLGNTSVELGKTIHVLRSGLGLELSDFARLMAIPTDRAEAMENGSIDITLDDLQKLSEVLRLPVRNLLLGTNVAQSA